MFIRGAGSTFHTDSSSSSYTPMPQHEITLISPTGRLHLIPPNAGDDEAVSILRSHPETRRYLRFWPEHTTVEDVRAQREERSEDPRVTTFYMHIQDPPKPEFAGFCGLLNVDSVMKSCCIGIVISPAYYKMGLCTETLYTLMKYTFEERGLHRGLFETGVDNVGMRRWLEEVAGVKEESILREAWVDGDGWLDVAAYTILDWEWRNEVKGRLEKRLVRKS